MKTLKTTLKTAAALATLAFALPAGAFSTSRNWSTGDSTFGGSASVSAYDTQTTSSYGIYANGGASVSVLSQSLSLANANASVKFDYTANRGTVGAYLNVLGNTVVNYIQSFSTGTSVSSPTYTRTSPAIRGTVWAGIVPVNLSASVSGSIRLDGSIAIQPGNPTTVLTASVGPVTSAAVSASASVSALIASAGVTGNMTLLSNTLKANGSVSYAIRAVSGRRAWTNYSVTSSFGYAAGTIDIWAKYLGTTYNKRLASWAGGNTGTTTLTSGGATIW